MATPYDYIRPYPLLNPRESMGTVNAQYDSTIAANLKWEEGDLVEVNSSGNVIRSIKVTAANIGRLAFASGPFDRSPLSAPRYAYYNTKGENLDVLREGHLVVFTFQGGAADAASEVFAEADADGVRTQSQRQLIWNTAQQVYTIRDATSTPNVQMVRIVEGIVGDSNVRVACKILPAFRLGA